MGELGACMGAQAVDTEDAEVELVAPVAEEEGMVAY